MKTISFDQVLEFQSCPMRWLLQRRYEANYNIPTEELYVKILRNVLDLSLAKWFETALLEADRVVKEWAVTWLTVAEQHGVEYFEAETFGLQGARVIRVLVAKLLSKYTVVDGPFNWRYDISELDTTVTGRALGLVRNKRKRNAAYAYHILELLPASHRFWPSQDAFRLLQVASRSCRELLERSIEKQRGSFPCGTATTLAISPRRGTVEEIEGTQKERSTLYLVDTLVDQMNALSVVPSNEPKKCGECPFHKACDLRYITPKFKERPSMARSEIEERLCIRQQSSSYDTWQSTLERIMGFSSQHRTVRVR